MKPQRVWKHVGKKTLAALLTATMLVTGTPLAGYAPRAEAKFGIDDVLELGVGALMGSMMRSQLLTLGDNPAVQAELFKEAGKSQEEDGAPDERAVSVTDDVMTRLVERGDYALKNNSLPFRWQVLHKDEFNAYCDYADHVCVYDKLVSACHYQADELAAVLAHEMAHGYNQHVARDAQKTILASMAADVALDAFDVSSVGVGSLLPSVFTNFLVIKNTTVASEKRADESGFYTMASAGFNPGGPAAMMARMLYFTEHSSQFEDFFFPSDHPDTRVRRDRMAKLLTAYGIGHPTVGTDAETLGNIYVDKTLLLTAEGEEDGLDAEEQSYLIAGGIAKGFHDCENFAAWSFRTDADGAIDFLDENAAYAPLKAALAASGNAAQFQTLVARAYASDAKSGARDKWLKDERSHAKDVAKEREKQAKAKKDAPKKSENGDMYLELGLTSFAAKEYTRSSALDADNPAATCGLAMVAGREGDTDTALAMVDDVLVHHANYARAFVARADIHRSMGDDDAALADCDAALAADEDAFVAHRIAGNIYDDRGDTAAALAAYRAYHEAVPTACDIPAAYITQIVDGIAEDAGEE